MHVNPKGKNPTDTPLVFLSLRGDVGILRFISLLILSHVSVFTCAVNLCSYATDLISMFYGAIPRQTVSALLYKRCFEGITSTIGDT